MKNALLTKVAYSQTSTACRYHYRPINSDQQFLLRRKYSNYNLHHFDGKIGNKK